MTKRIFWCCPECKTTPIQVEVPVWVYQDREGQDIVGFADNGDAAPTSYRCPQCREIKPGQPQRTSDVYDFDVMFVTGFGRNAKRIGGVYNVLELLQNVVDSDDNETLECLRWLADNPNLGGMGRKDRPTIMRITPAATTESPKQCDSPDVLDYVERVSHDYANWLEDALTYLDRDAKIAEAQRALRNRLMRCLTDEGFIAEVGDTIVNIREELDDDDGEERRTPPGSKGRIVSICAGTIHVNFPNGAGIALTQPELYDPDQYTWIPTPKET